jgi:hypothetical protein
VSDGIADKDERDLHGERTSTLLRALASGGPARVSLRDLAHGLRNRALGLMLVVFGAPCMAPAPPPIPLICATAVLLVAVSLMTGRPEPWLPERLARRTLPGEPLRKVLRRIVPLAERIERWCRPRMPSVSSRAGKAVIGGVVAVMAIVVLLPIPILGNFTPGLAIVVTGVGLSERDGLVMSIGVGLAVFALAFTSAVAWAAVEAARWAL